MNSSHLLMLMLMVCGGTCLSLPGLRSRSTQTSDVSRFKVKVTESGTTFNEEVEVNTKEKTETFHVPQHNRVDLSDIMHMFELNMTIYRFPLKGVCYVAPLKGDQPSPKQLVDDMTEASQGIDNGDTIIKEGSTYRIKGKVQDFQFWDLRIQSFCSGLEVYHVELVENVDTITVESQADHDKRVRRQSNSPSCPVTTGQTCNNPSWNCWIEGQSCSYFLICTPKKIFRNGRHYSVKQCDLKHRFDTITCCTPICTK